MAKGTPATLALAKAGIVHQLIEYDYDPGAQRVGLQAASAIGEDPARVLKTLMLLVDDKPACAVIPSDRELSLKKVASAFGGKAAKMMPPPQAERMTGYVVGGISPFGQKRKVPTAIETSATSEPYIIVNGGRRGLQVKLAPADAIAALDATAAELIA